MSVPEELLQLRRTIDNLDTALVHILAERFAATRQVGLFKARQGMPAVDQAREESQVARLRAAAAGAGLSPDFLETLIRMVMAEVVRQHERIAEEHRAGR